MHGKRSAVIGKEDLLGSVFQTVLPFWAGIWGSEDPRILRSRPAGGAASAARVYADFGGASRVGCGGVADGASDSVVGHTSAERGC